MHISIGHSDVCSGECPWRNGGELGFMGSGYFLHADVPGNAVE